MSRCWGCCQENCGYKGCTCACHETALPEKKVDKVKENVEQQVTTSFSNVLLKTTEKIQELETRIEALEKKFKDLVVEAQPIKANQRWPIKIGDEWLNNNIGDVARVDAYTNGNVDYTINGLSWHTTEEDFRDRYTPVAPTKSIPKVEEAKPSGIRYNAHSILQSPEAQKHIHSNTSYIPEEQSIKVGQKWEWYDGKQFRIMNTGNHTVTLLEMNTWVTGYANTISKRSLLANATLVEEK